MDKLELEVPFDGTYPTNVLELLGANIVSMDNEGPVVLLHEGAELGIILQIQR